MEREKVDSSMLASVGYDEATRTLEVEFSSGTVYRYFDVPPEDHRALMAADSIGRHMNANVKGLFQSARVS